MTPSGEIFDELSPKAKKLRDLKETNAALVRDNETKDGTIETLRADIERLKAAPDTPPSTDAPPPPTPDAPPKRRGFLIH